MSNRKIAITWAEANLTDDNFILSDKFFKPFSDAVRKGIVRELQRRGIEVYSVGLPNGAVLVRRNSTAIMSTSEYGAVLTNKQRDTVVPVFKYGTTVLL